MRLLTLMFFLMTSACTVWSQERILDFENYFNFDDKKVLALDAFHNDRFDQTIFILEDRQSKNAYLFDKNFKEISDGLKITKEVRKFPNSLSIVASKEQAFSFLMSNDDFNKWGLLNLNFDARTILAQEVPINLKKALYVSSFSSSDKHWVVSLVKNSSKFKIQSVDDTGAVDITEYDFSNTDFSGGLRSIGNIYQLVNAKSEEFSIDYIEEDTPLSLLSTNEKMKIYKEGDELVISIDNSRDFTYLIKINIEEKTSNVITIEKKKFEERSSYEDSNSFVYGNKLFTLKTTFDILNLSITDLKTKQLLKTFEIQGDEDIWFRNTALFQKRLGARKTSEIAKTKTFLRKVANSEPAISVHKQDDHLVVTLGASKFIDRPDNALVTGALLGGASGYLLVSVVINPISKNYLDYSSTKTTRFQMILNTDLTHVDNGTVKENTFDIIEGYDQSQSIKGAKTVFKIDGNYYFSYINKETKKLQCIRF